VSTGLHLEAPFSGDAEALLDGIVEELSGRSLDPPARGEVEGATLYLELHPAAEPVMIEARDGRVVLRANTITAGPGYHRFVVEIAESLDLTWAAGGDPSEWRESRDDAALDAFFLDWLSAGAAQIIELASEGMSGFALAMPAGVAFDHDGVVATQLGPRSMAWLEAVRREPADGVDVFPWWGPAKDAGYFRGLALTEAWRTIRWRAPLIDEERAALERFATWTEKAHGLDPELDLPWAEQSEILTYLEESSLRATRAHLKAQELGEGQIGYRRRHVRVELSGGWHLSVPGELAERWDERGTWVGWDESRSVFFNSFTAETDGPTPSTQHTLSTMPPLEGDELLELERDELRGIAALSEIEEDGRPLHRLEAHAAIGPHAAIGTLVFSEPGDREWALATWGSLGRD